VKTISWYSPKPKQKPKRLPRRRPIKTVPSGIGDQGIVGNWLFYYLKGGDHLHDFSPYRIHGTINGAKWVDGRYGWALSFDGVDDYVKVPDSDSLDITDEITMTAWIKLTATDHQWSVCNKGIAYILFEADAGGTATPYCAVHIGGSWQLYDYGENADWFKGEWHYVVMTYDGSNVKTWIDGQLDQTYSQTGAIDTSTGWLGIGEDSVTTTRWFEGTISFVRIYSVAKSASWIKRRFERTKGIFR